jgi:hypothetical protein
MTTVFRMYNVVDATKDVSLRFKSVSRSSASSKKTIGLPSTTTYTSDPYLIKFGSTTQFQCEGKIFTSTDYTNMLLWNGEMLLQVVSTTEPEFSAAMSTDDFYFVDKCELSRKIGYPSTMFDFKITLQYAPRNKLKNWTGV